MDELEGNIYKCFEIRKRSFDIVNLPPLVSPTKLATAGLYFNDDSKCVQCAWCGGVISNWTLGGYAFGEHMRNFPKCEFVCHIIREAEACSRLGIIIKKEPYTTLMILREDVAVQYLQSIEPFYYEGVQTCLY